MTDNHLSNQPIVELDVREMLRNKEEPFQVIMSTVQTLPDGHALRLLTTFEPVPLFKVLGKQGFSHECNKLGDDDYETIFRKE